MQIRLKDSTINLDGLSVHILEALATAAWVWQRYGMLQITITSARDGKHKPASLHYHGNALDIRTRDVPDALSMADELREELPDEFDVILESDHLHIEYDPKR